MGARQVGKTWLMKAFAEERYPDDTIFVDLHDDEPLCNAIEDGNAGGDENVDVLFRSAANPGWKPGGITFKDFTTQKESRWRRSWAAWVTTQNPTLKSLPDIKGKVNVITVDGKPTVSVEM